MPCVRIRGFTLVELMVTIAIVAILLAIGLPSFQGALRSNRIATTTNEMIGSVALARSEAIRTTLGGGMCATDDGTSCGDDWNAGWLVWANVGAADEEFTAGDTVIRVIDAHPQLLLSVEPVGGGAAVDTIAFDARGRPDARAEITLEPVDCPTGQELIRTMTVNLVGQLTTAPSACP
nr:MULTISPECIES: GspH/FimT family pseudopilin [Luteimonas]